MTNLSQFILNSLLEVILQMNTQSLAVKRHLRGNQCQDLAISNIFKVPF